MPDKSQYIVRLSSMEMEAISRPADHRKAEKIARDCRGRMCQVEKDSEEIVRLAPPQLFNLAALQTEAGRIFGYTAERTKGLTLSLHGKGLLTDPVTDSRNLPAELGYAVEKLIRLLAKELPFLHGVALPDMEVRQMFGPDDETGRSHAILPILTSERWGEPVLTQPERNLLHLIGSRVIIAAASTYICINHKSQLTCNYHTFYLECCRTRQAGYRDTEMRMEEYFKGKQNRKDPKEVDTYLGKVFGPCDSFVEQWKE